MLKIRMQRTGRINMPSYRIVVTEHARGPKAGKFVERLGSYDPKTKQRTLSEDRVKYWMSVGAQPSATMHNMLVSLGILNAKKINVLPAFVEKKVEAAVEVPTSTAEVPAESAPEAPEAAAAQEPTAEAAVDEPKEVLTDIPTEAQAQ